MPELAITGDALKVFLRLAEHPTELIPQRCDALGMDRAQEVRARKILESKGFVAPLEQTLGNRVKFYELTAKGVEWASQHNIKVKQYKSGPLHEYLLNQVEKLIGAVNPKFSFQRHSPIAREHGLEPDSVLQLPGGQRVIIEICCNSMNYEAQNLRREQQIDGVDKVLAVMRALPAACGAITAPASSSATTTGKRKNKTEKKARLKHDNRLRWERGPRHNTTGLSQVLSVPEG